MVFILGIVAALVVLALGVMVFSVIVALLAAAVAVAIAAMAGAAAGMLATVIAQAAGAGEPGMVGVPVGIVVFLGAATLLLGRMFGKRAAVRTRPLPQFVTDVLPEPEPVERDADVRAAWVRAQELLPKAALVQAARARADCAALLDMADGDTLDPALIDFAAVVRRNVPALVRQVDALWRTAPRAEQAELAQELADGLDQLGAAARVHVDRQRAALRDGLAAIRNHVAARTGE